MIFYDKNLLIFKDISNFQSFILIVEKLKNIIKNLMKKISN